VQDLDPDSSIDFTVEIGSSKESTTLQLGKGVLRVTGPFVPFGTLVAVGGDIIQLSHRRKQQIETLAANLEDENEQVRVIATRQLVKFEAEREIETLSKHQNQDVRTAVATITSTTRLLKQFRFLVAQYNGDPEFVESLALGPRKNWAMIIGQKLYKQPESLNRGDRLSVANEILKDREAVNTLHQMHHGQIAPILNEWWFYIQALFNAEKEIRESAAWTLFQVVANLESKEMEEATKALLEKGQDQNEVAQVRGTCVYTLSSVMGAINEQLFKETVMALIRCLNDKLEAVRSRSAFTLGSAGQRIRAASLEQAVKNALSEMLNETGEGVRVDSAVALARISSKLENDLLERVVNVFLGSIQSIHEEMRGSSLTGLTTPSVLGNLKGALLDRVIKASENALAIEKAENIRKLFESALNEFKARKAKLDKK
jgi:hypothetical protein